MVGPANRSTVAALVVAIGTTCAPGVNAADGAGRLLPQGARLIRAVHEATVRSATFRMLLEAIGQNDGIVYVE